MYTGTSDLKAIELVQRISSLTSSGKLRWASEPLSLRTQLAGRFSITFVLSLPMPAGGRDWSQFTVRDVGGREILKVEKNPLSMSPPPGSPSSSILEELDRLFSHFGLSVSAIDEAIDELKKLERGS